MCQLNSGGEYLLFEVWNEYELLDVYKEHFLIMNDAATKINDVDCSFSQFANYVSNYTKNSMNITAKSWS